jgi:hypothetical protein
MGSGFFRTGVASRQSDFEQRARSVAREIAREDRWDVTSFRKML